MDFTLLQPGWLGLLVLVPLFGLFPRPGGFGRAFWLRAACAVCLIVALARPVVTNTLDVPHHVLVMDRSGLRGEAAQGAADAFAKEWAEALPRGARASWIERGAGAVSSPERSDLELVTLVAGATLDEALGAATARVPAAAAGGVTLITSGLGAGSEASRIAADLARRQVPVNSLGPFPDDVPRVVGIKSLAPVRLGGNARIEVTLAGRGSGLAFGLFVDGSELAQQAGVDVDGRASWTFEFEPERSGFLELRVELSGPGVEPERSALSGTLPVDDPLRAMYLGPDPANGAALAALVGPGIVFDAPAGDDLGGFDLAVVDDLDASAFPAGLDRALAQAVTQDGLGLFACGARSAFGAGGWQDTALEDVLPVEALQKEEKRDPSVAVAIVIDTSGSMGGNRVQLAKEVARLSMRRLLPHDKVGIVEFYGAKRWAAPLQPASNNIELERALNRLAAGGGTVILPAIEEAFYGLLNVDARFKHILVLTDGGVESGAFEPLLRRMATRGITTSTVLIGGDAHSEFLVTLANWGKGRFYAVPNRFNLPEILLKQPTSAKLSAWQPGAAGIVAGGGPAWWGDLDPSAVPPVEGLVETRLREGATSVLETAEGTRPVLASWRHGLGRVTAMPIEPTGPGSAGWKDWPDYGRFLARTLERTARDLVPFAFELDRHGNQARLVATRRTERTELAGGAGGSPQPFARSTDGLEFVMQERAPGRFEAHWTIDANAALQLEAGARGSTSFTRLAADAVLPGHEDPAQALDLAAIAQATGGAQLAPGDAPDLRTSTSTTMGLRELSPWLLGLALALYLFDLFDRRRDRKPAGAR